MSGRAEDARNSSQQMVFSPLLQAIIRRNQLRVVGAGDVDVFLAGQDAAVLFFPGDAARIAESDDVAVILPELLKRTWGADRRGSDRGSSEQSALAAAVVSREAERALQLRYRFNAFPALVFFRRGGWLGAIVRLMGWADYLHEIERILALEPGEPPPFALPGRSGAAPWSNGGNHEQ